MPEGHCLCGAVRYRYQGPPVWQAHCHCESCRRACSAPFTTFIAVKDGDWQWTGVEPRLYASSPGVERGFCGTCGSPILYRSDEAPGEMHFLAATLADPSGVIPERHDFWEERMPWVDLADRLPRE